MSHLGTPRLQEKMKDALQLVPDAYAKISPIATATSISRRMTFRSAPQFDTLCHTNLCQHRRRMSIPYYRTPTPFLASSAALHASMRSSSSYAFYISSLLAQSCYIANLACNDGGCALHFSNELLARQGTPVHAVCADALRHYI